MSVFAAETQSTQGKAIDLSTSDYDNSAKQPMRAILVGVAGNVVGRQVDDAADVTYPLQAGVTPLRFSIIRKSGTTATGLVALF